MSLFHVTSVTLPCYLCRQVSVTGVCVGVGVPQGLESANTTISLSSRGSFKHSMCSPLVSVVL